MKRAHAWFASLGLILATLALPAPARPGETDEVLERGKLIALCWPHQESVFVRRMVEKHGREGLHIIGGIDVEVLEAFTERLGVELEMKAVQPNFGALIPALLAGEGDVIASSMTITRNRSEKVDFTRPYFTVHKVVLTRRGSGISSVDDLDGKVAATAHGSSHEEHLLALGLENLRLEPVQFMLENYEKVAHGEADFTLVDSSSAKRVLRQYSDLRETLEVAFTFPESDGFGFAVRPGSDLLPRLNEFLAELEESGELRRIISQYIPDLPDAP